MNRSKANDLLLSSDADERLTGARYFSEFAKPSDIDNLRSVHAQENESYVKKALFAGIARASSVLPEPEMVEELDIDIDDIKARAIEETTKMLIHEFRPIVASIVRFAEAEMGSSYAASRTKIHVAQLQRLLKNISHFGEAASQPKIEEFEFSTLIDSIIEGDIDNDRVQIVCAGQRPFVVTGDQGLIERILKNGLRNAVEATLLNGPPPGAKVILSWGESDEDYWTIILDRGLGPPVGSHAIWDLGNTNKEGHLGMGLTIARRAANSMSGEIELLPRENGGAAFEFHWPKIKIDENSDS